MFTRLRSLQLSSSDWKIKIRVTRTWDSFDDNHDFIGMNMILIDVEVINTNPGVLCILSYKYS